MVLTHNQGDDGGIFVSIGMTVFSLVGSIVVAYDTVLDVVSGVHVKFSLFAVRDTWLESLTGREVHVAGIAYASAIHVEVVFKHDVCSIGDSYTPYTVVITLHSQRLF